MTTLDEQIAALESNREQLKGPLRQRYAEVHDRICVLRAPEQALQAQRDRLVDTLTQADDRVLCGEIKAARRQAEAAGVLDLEAEQKKILRALTDVDGKARLSAA